MRLPPTSLLRERNYRLVYSAALASGFGTQVTIVALPLIAVLSVGAGPLEVGTLLACASVAVALIGLPAGPWVDRLHRRKVMIASDVGRALLLGSIPLAWWLDALTMGQLYVVALIEGALSVLFDVAAQSYLPYVIGKDRLVEGNAGLGAVESVARSAGPGLAGVVIALVTAPVAVVVDAVSYVVSAVAVTLVDRPEPEPRRAAARQRLGAEIAEGLRWLWRHPLLRPVTLASAASNFFGTVSWVTLVALMGDVLRLPAWTIGLVYAAGGVGGLIGALFTRRLVDRLGMAGTLCTVFAWTVPFQLLIPLAGEGWRILAAVAGQIGIWASISIRNVAQVSIRQQSTPAELLTRVNASARFLSWGGLPLGALTAGVASEFLGVRATLWAAAVCLALTGLSLFLSPVRALRTAETASAPRSGPAETF